MNTIIILAAKYLFLIVVGGACLVALSLPKTERLRLAIAVALAGILGIIFTKSSGALYFDPRPFVAHHFQPLILHAPDNGFPSDHTVLSMSAALLALHRSKPAGIGLVGLALLVGLARIAVGIHTPLDIIAAIIIAAVAVNAAYALAPAIERRLRPSGGHD